MSTYRVTSITSLDNLDVYIFIDNQNIVKEKHLWKDKMHLNRDGLNILANNFIESLNNVFRKH